MSYSTNPMAVTITNSKSITCNVDNTTGSIVCFTITGSVKVLQLYGVVTTVLSASFTAAHWRTNDQTAAIVISAAAGTDISSAPVKSLIARTGLVATALTLNTAATATLIDAASAGTDTFTPFIVTKKGAAVTTIDFRYTDAAHPSTGVIQMFLVWEPLSADAAVS